MPDVEGVLDVYRDTMAGFRSNELARQARMAVELRSREFLCVWVVYCLVHHSEKAAHPLLESYGVCLRWADLRHLVLRDRGAWEALLNVRSYLAQNEATSRPLFSLKTPLPTFAFAEAFALNGPDPAMRETWEKEKADAKIREDKYWAEVRRKQELARQLRAEIATLEAEACRLETERAAAARARLLRTEYYLRGIKSHEENVVESLLQSNNRQLRGKRQELDAAEKAPAPVYQPLPQDRRLAMRAIFFLAMPPDLATLSRLSFMAQQMLLPLFLQRDAALQSIKVPEPQADVQSYVTSRSDRIASASLRVGLGSHYAVPKPNAIGPSHVDHLTRSSHGIWHPDLLCDNAYVRMLWRGGNGALDKVSSLIDPFLLGDHCADLIAEDFTERLPASVPSAATLQWALLQTGHDSPTRGNEALARQDERPHWLSKPQYLAFCSLRAYPLLQLEKLCTFVLDRQLPLDQPAVHTLLRQTLFQLGTLTPDPPHLEWKADHLGPGAHGFERLTVALAELADELRHAPRERSALRLVGEMAAFVAQWHPQARQVTRDTADSARRWAQELEAQVEEAAESKPDHVAELRARQCAFHCYALLNHACGELSSGDAAQLVELAVLSNHVRVFEGPTSQEGEVRQLTVLTQHVMATRLPALLPHLTDALLTKAVTLAIQSTPASLHWRRSQGDACFEAACDAGHLYSLNLLTGLVLFDGRPPRRLPPSILAHPLYKRVFSGRDFETVLGGSGVIRTVRAVAGCFYEFYQQQDGGRLVIIEETEGQGQEGPVRLELLERTQKGQWMAWCSDLPRRLQELHSHWLWREQGLLLLRGVGFLNTCVDFVMTRKAGGQWSTLRVPAYLRSSGPRAIHQALSDAASASAFDRLGYLTSQREVLHVMSRLEDSDYIHTYHSPTISGVLISLPRFRLEFELKMREGEGGGWALWCQDFGGEFYLPAVQHLIDTLRGFKGYLLLQHRVDKSLKVVIPCGEVSVGEEEEDGSHVSIAADSSSAAERRVHYYDVHPRLLHLHCPTVSARLRLACLYAACSTRLPEPRQRMTGAEVAVQLLRQCWVNRPYQSQEDLSCLQALRGPLSRRWPSLSLLCLELQCSSRQLSALYGLSEEERLVMPKGDPRAVTAYLNELQPLNPRLALRPEEEQRVLGLRRVGRRDEGRVLPEHGSVEIGDCGVAADEVSKIEAELQQLLCLNPPPDDPAAFPLSSELLEDTVMGQRLVAELQRSHATHHAQTTPSLRHNLAQTLRRLDEAQGRVSARREQVEAFLLTSLATLPEHERGGKSEKGDWHATAVRLQRLSCLVPQAGLQDLLCLALDPSLLPRVFNPFFSAAAKARFHAALLLWMQLCVLEDRLRRLRAHAHAHREAELMQELQVRSSICIAMSLAISRDTVDYLTDSEWLTWQVHRNWEAKNRVEWLVFEVENCLQIRPMQVSSINTYHPLPLLARKDHICALANIDN